MMVQMNWRPADRQLRQFGLISLAALPAAAWFWWREPVVTAVFAAVGVLLAVLGCWRPRTLALVFLCLSLLALPIGLVVGELLLLVMYFGIFLPLGLAFRLFRRDTLQLAWRRDARTYWRPKTPAKDHASYLHQW